MKKKGNIMTIVWCALVGILGLVVCLLIALFITRIFDDSNILGDVFAGVVSVAAGVLLYYQLRKGDKTDGRHADVEESDFILEYNRSFIENKEMYEVEEFLESRITGQNCTSIKNPFDNRQKLLNYLVYLEGFASCVNREIINIENIDHLFSYRFFIAMNHPVMQSMEIIPYANYYKGCFELYDRWITYRIDKEKSLKFEKDSVPLFETALCYHKDYEKYAAPHISVNESESKIFVTVKGSKKIVVEYDKNTNKITVEKCGSKAKAFKYLVALLKHPLFSRDDFNKNNTLTVDCKFYTKDDVLAEIANVKNANEIYGRDRLLCHQLTSGSFSAKSESTDKVLGVISELIYNTDNYIFPDLLVSEDLAKEVLPKVIRSGNDAMFNCKNLYLCECEGEVLGLILWCDKDLPSRWSEDTLKRALGKNINATSFDRVVNEYMSNCAFDDADITILNLCVSESARKKGVGTKMLSSFLQEHDGETVKLCVLSENGAIKLYEKCGFNKVGDEQQAYPSTMQNHTRIVMERKG